jgi:hypothetical protein
VDCATNAQLVSPYYGRGIFTGVDTDWASIQELCFQYEVRIKVF